MRYAEKTVQTSCNLFHFHGALWAILFAVVYIASPITSYAQQSTPAPVTTDNSNVLVKKHREQLKLSSSSFWPGWPESNAFDGNPQTSWFTARGDAAAFGKEPWLEVTFPEDVQIRRITVLGNRDPAWLNGYTILGGRVEVYDKDGEELFKQDDDGRGTASDFDFKFKMPLDKVRRIRFRALGDEGRENPYDDVAIGEIQVE